MQKCKAFFILNILYLIKKYKLATPTTQNPNPTVRMRATQLPLMLYEALRAYYSVNSSGQLNWLFKLCACLIQPLIAPVTIFETQRITAGILANSPFQIGQTTNVLNYLYDNVLNRIYITQGYFLQVVDTTFAYAPINWDDVFANPPQIFEREFDDQIEYFGAIIHVPVSVNLSALTATVAQMAIQGISYQILTF